MFKRLLLTACLVGCAAPAIPQFWIGQAVITMPTTGWFPLRIDAGGFVPGMDIQCNQGVGACSTGVGSTTKVAITDTGGAYVWNGSLWVQTLTYASMPLADFTYSGYFNYASLVGVCAMRIAPSNTSRLYMYYTWNQGPGYIYTSVNKGLTWTRTGFANLTCNAANGNLGPEQFGPKMAVDPANELVVYAGTESGGVYYTLNGGTSWTQISTGVIPAGAAYPTNWNLIYFDPSDATGNTVYISSNGTGVYKCTSAATSPSCNELNSANMPTLFCKIFVDPSGNLWVVDSDVGGDCAGNLWEHTGGVPGTWTEKIASGIQSTVAVDPNAPTHFFSTTYKGDMWFSTNSGSTWTDSATGPASTGGAVPWMAHVVVPAGGSTAAIADFQFDPTSGLAYFPSGTGIWQGTPVLNTSTVMTYDGSASVGIQNLDAVTGVAPPSGPNVMLNARDRALWLISDPTRPQANYFPVYDGVDPGWAASYRIGSPSTLYAVTGGAAIFYSTNSGASWSPASASPGVGAGGNLLAVSDTEAVFNLGGNEGPQCLTSGSISGGSGTAVWGNCTFNNGTTNAGGGWINIYQYGAQQMTLDGAGNYCLMNAGGGTNTSGFYQSTDGKAFTFQQSLPALGSDFSQMKLVPGHNSDLFYNPGFQPHQQMPTTTLLYRSTAGCGGTWSAVANVKSVFAYGLGAAMSGSDGYPTLYCICWVNNGGGYTYGTWRAVNIDTGSPIWTELDATTPCTATSSSPCPGFPNGNPDWAMFLAADYNVAGRFYVGFFGSSFAYGQFNYLLKRDLGHANDNVPMWFNEAA